jgi:hypothetical protein
MVALPHVPQCEPGLDPLALGIQAASAQLRVPSGEVATPHGVAQLGVPGIPVALEAGRLGGAGDREGDGWSAHGRGSDA